MTIIYFKKTIIFITVFLSWFGLVHANIVINEVQISPTEERFIELYNSGSSSVDLTNWYIQRKTASGSEFGSLVSKTNFEGKSINAGSYFLISKIEMGNSDLIIGNLTLTESNIIQIKNSSQEVVDKVGWGEVDDCGDNCAPNPPEGKSIQRISNGNWIIANHTPKSLNSNSGSNEEENNEEDSSNNDEEDTNSDNTKTKDTPEVFKISTKIISPKIVTAGIPFSINSLTTSNKGDTYAVGRFVWNFGDGFIKETKESTPFSYLYEYPGDYVLTLSYFDSYFDQIADVTNRLIIKVIPSEISISSVGDDKNPYIELENKSSYEIILSKWVITGGIHYFIIPEGTTILPNKKMKLSPKITGFNGEDIKSVVITNPDSGIIATYPATIIKQKIKNSGNTEKNKNETPVLQNEISQGPTNDAVLNDSQVINLNDLGASVSDSGVKSKTNSILPIIGLFVVIDIGVTSFLLLRKRKKESSDYVEKEIRAEDMKIVE